TGERLSDTAAQAKDTLTDQAQQLKGTFDTLLREQPLVVGALGIALGALLGASLPRTETEDRALGTGGSVVAIADPQATARAILALLRNPGRWQA
ncbi:hypothetical protein KQH43_30835, partial [Streptomyces sp. EL5]|nr:hypothetical protein [Streptomyces sp. EL5]